VLSQLDKTNYWHEQRWHLSVNRAAAGKACDGGKCRGEMRSGELNAQIRRRSGELTTGEMQLYEVASCRAAISGLAKSSRNDWSTGMFLTEVRKDMARLYVTASSAWLLVRIGIINVGARGRKRHAACSILLSAHREAPRQSRSVGVVFGEK